MASMTNEELVRQLGAAYGGGLRAVVLYGSGTSAEERAGKGDANVLVIVDELAMPQLRAVAATTRAWSEAGNAPPFTLTTAEWRSSADIFPMEYAEVLEQHRVLHGTLPMDGIAVAPAELRIQVEQQVLGKLLQLRQGVLLAGGMPKRQLSLLEDSLSTRMVVFRGVVRLHGERPPADYVALAQRVGTMAGFDPAPFVRVVRHARGMDRLSPEAAEGILAAYLAALEALVAHVDRLAIAR